MSDEDLLPSRTVLKVLGGVVVVGVALCLIAALVLWLRERQLRPSLHFSEQELPPPRRVAEVRQQVFEVVPPNAEPEMSGWGWVDKKKGIVRIPIEQAIDLVASGTRP